MSSPVAAPTPGVSGGTPARLVSAASGAFAFALVLGLPDIVRDGVARARAPPR